MVHSNEEVPEENDQDSESPIKSQAGLTIEEKMQLWGNLTSTALDKNQIPPEDKSDYENYVLTHFPNAWKFLIESYDYKWLLGKVKSECLLAEAKGTRMERIREDILNALRTKTRQVSFIHEVHTASFEISCRLSAFIKE